MLKQYKVFLNEIQSISSSSLLRLQIESSDDSLRTFTRVGMNPFTCYRGHGDEEKEDEEEVAEKHANTDLEALHASLEAEKKRDFLEGKKEPSGCAQPNDPPLYLIDKVLPPEFIDTLNGLLNQSVSKLTTSQLLQEKVLRVCLSYGHEVSSIQPEIITLLEKFTIKKSDLLKVDEAGLIFGGFMIPKEVDDILREMNGMKRDDDDDDEDGYDRYGRTYDVEPESDEELEELRQEMLKERKLKKDQKSSISGTAISSPVVPFAHPTTMLNAPPPTPNKYQKHHSSKKKKKYNSFK